MTYYSSYYVFSPYDIEHHGILGMKWGVRRYQNKDGTLTEAGKKRYGSAENFNADRAARRERNVKIAKTAGKVALGVAGAAATAGAGYLINKYAGAQIASLAKPAVDAGRKAVSGLLSKMQKEPAIYDPLDPTYLVNHNTDLTSERKASLIKQRDADIDFGLAKAVSGNDRLTERMRSVAEQYNKQGGASSLHEAYENDSVLGTVYRQALDEANSKMLKEASKYHANRNPINADYIEIPSEGKTWTNGKVSAWDAKTTKGDPINPELADYLRWKKEKGY